MDGDARNTKEAPALAGRFSRDLLEATERSRRRVADAGAALAPFELSKPSSEGERTILEEGLSHWEERAASLPGLIEELHRLSDAVGAEAGLVAAYADAATREAFVYTSLHRIVLAIDDRRRMERETARARTSPANGRRGDKAV